VTTPRPYTLVAELTHRCPLACPYCANPTTLVRRDGELDTSTWTRVLAEAEAAGVIQVHLTGGEPLARPDLEELVAHARSLGLYTQLVTSGVPLDFDRLVRLADAGLDAVQLSLQDVDDGEADRIAGSSVSAHKRHVAEWIRRLRLPLTINVVLHRGNIDRVPQLIALAEALEADRLELANAQYLGWALVNRAALLPSASQLARAGEHAASARTRLRGVMEVVFVLPDYHRGVPKACMDGWGRRYVVVTPEGRVQPCHQAGTIAGLEMPTVHQGSLAALWLRSAAFEAFRGNAWMREPCRSCPQRDVDFGGCRCQAFALTGDATATDPACRLSPAHTIVAASVAIAAEAPSTTLRYRAFSPMS
jgi:pyrroloquinoline quinone biosynthesis protein E